MRMAFILAVGMFVGLQPIVVADQKSKQPTNRKIVFFGYRGPIVFAVDVRMAGKPLPKVWDAAMAKILARADKNKDGKLNAKEVIQVPATSRLFGGAFSFSGQTLTLAQLDGNKDGSVSREEISQYYQRQGRGPFQVSTNGANNAFGGILVDRPLSFNNNSSGQAAKINRRVFQLLDVNRDGALTKSELSAGTKRLLKLDTNDDEMVSLAELLDERQRPSTNGVFVVRVGGGLSRNGKPGEIVDANAKGLAQRLLAKYGGKGATSLTRQQMGWTKTAFQALDRDKNGRADKSELSRIGDVAPVATVRVKMGSKIPATFFNPSMTIVANGANKKSVKVRHGLGGTAAVELGNESIAFMANSNQQGAIVRFGDTNRIFEMQFQNADSDNNDYLDKKEAQRFALLRNQFDLADGDGNGMVFLKEFITMMKAQQELQNLASKSCVTMSISEIGNGFFDLLENRKDGGLGIRELRALPKLLAKLDTNRDGRLTQQEIPRKFTARFQAGGVGGNGQYAFVTRASTGGRRRSPPNTNGPKWFRQMDLNADGDVSRREFLGSTAIFQRLDIDRDGLISLGEAAKGDKQFRGK